MPMRGYSLGTSPLGLGVVVVEEREGVMVEVKMVVVVVVAVTVMGWWQGMALVMTACQHQQWARRRVALPLQMQQQPQWVGMPS